MNGGHSDHNRSFRAPPTAPSSSSSSASGVSNAPPAYRSSPYYGSQPPPSVQVPPVGYGSASSARYAVHDNEYGGGGGIYSNGGNMMRQAPQASPSAATAAAAAAAAAAHAHAQAQQQSQRQPRPRPTSQQRIAMEKQQLQMNRPLSPIAPAALDGNGRGSLTYTSAHAPPAALSSQLSRSSATNRKKRSTSPPVPPPPPPIEEGDYVWVSDPGSMCVPAVVARVGYYYDEAHDQEKPVVVVHTEEGEEREMRDDRTLVRLPLIHHPKTKPSLEIHDLSSLALMATNDIGRNEIFSTEQLENIVLYTLRSRYRMEQVFTWVDRVLVSVNPVVPLPIFTPDHMQAYNKSHETTDQDASAAGGANDAPPHVFAVAQNAIQSMQEAEEDQAVILLGGMGSGKSEAAKLVVQYLCEIGENPMRSEAESDPGVLHPIGQQILHAFTVLEAFGNAATPQNPNSSRFAKMISVEFSRHGFVIGGGFTTHYFEKSRVIERRDHERNFHVFYQVLAGVQHDPTLRDALELNKPASDFALLRTASSGEPSDPSRPVDTAAMDARDYRDLMSSFSALRIRKNQRMEIVRVIAAILHLGNVEFIPDAVQPDGKPTAPGTADHVSSSGGGTGMACALKDPTQIVLAARLLEVEPVVLDNYFRTRQFFSKDSTNKTVSSLKVVTVAQARKARDTFIRSLYESLFNFLVETLNGILGGIFDRYEKSNIVLHSQGIHVLDIVGFENLEGGGGSGTQYNGFDQLCFNYWSEKVHSFFIQNTLATNVGTESVHVEHRLTQNAQFDLVSGLDACLSLFESVPFGIFALLNDHSKVRSPNDEDLVSKILGGNEGIPSLARPNLGQGVTSEYLTPSKEWRSLFVVAHYCGKVTYSGRGLSSKNTLSISATCAAIMHSSKNAVLRAVGTAQIAAAGGKQTKSHGPHSKFVSSTKDVKASDRGDNASACSGVMHQADALLNALNHTGKNFVVCVKPNAEMEDGEFESEFVMKQIRDAHLVDLIRASRSVYSVRLTRNHFFGRYKRICGHRGTLESLLRSLSAIGVLEEEKFVVGTDTVYLTSHQWKKLEQARSLYMNACATMIQRNLVRGASRKKSARILALMKSLREAMQRRASDQVVHILSDCAAVLGKRGVDGIRVLKEAKQSLSRLDEEAYVQSVVDDAQSMRHLVVIDYALSCAEKWCPHLSVDNLRALRQQMLSSRESSALKAETSAIVNEQLRSSIIQKDPDALMAALATLEEASMESLERKLATMMIIRALEEKSVVENLASVVAKLTSQGNSDDLSGDAMVKALLAPALKAVEYGLEAKFVDVDTLLAQCREEENATVDHAHGEKAGMATGSDASALDPTSLLAALDKAVSEDNLVAAQRVLKRLLALGVHPTDLMVDAAKRIDTELGSISVANERKLVLKFLNIAKISQDLELLNEAIDGAVDAGLAKWDFNLKNAERERDKLLAASGGCGPSTMATTATTSGASSPAQATPAASRQSLRMSAAASMRTIWMTASDRELQALKPRISTDLVLFLDAKISRLLKVADVEQAIRRALSRRDLVAIEDAFQRAIGLGYSDDAAFRALFDEYQAVQKKKTTPFEPELGVLAAVRFFSSRLDRNAEVREDALDLLSNELQFLGPSKRESTTSTTLITYERRQEVESTVQALRRRLENCFTAAHHLESAILLPAETLSVAKLETTLEAAKKAGVHSRLLAKAEDTIFVARRSTLTIGDRPSVSTVASSMPSMGDNDDDAPPVLNPRADLTRMMSDTTGWDGDLHETSGGDHGESRDASAFHEFERLRAGSSSAGDSLADRASSSSSTVVVKKLAWEGRALAQSLSLLDDTADCRLALSINRCVLGYMRDRIVFYREMLAQYILQIGLVKSSLVDEIYLQLMKQLTKNPKRDSSIRGWSLFAMCATSFPPSQALEKYVLLFLQSQTTESNSFWRLVKNFAAYSLKKLENLLENGATGFIPSIEEIRGYEARPPFLCTIELLDGTPLAEQFPVTPELSVDHLVEICAHFLGLDDRFSKFLGICAVAEKHGSAASGRSNSTATIPGTSFVSATPALESHGGDDGPSASGSNGSSATSVPGQTSYFHKFLAATTFLNGDVFLGDIFEKELIRGRELKFQLKIRLHPLYVLRFEDEMYDRLMYIQLQDEIVRGNLLLLEQDAVVRFASIALAVDCGDALPRNLDELLDLNVNDYLPVEWQATRSEEDWAEAVLAFWRANLLLPDDDDGDDDAADDDRVRAGGVVALTVNELQRIYIEEAARHRLYGASFFPCKLLARSATAKRDLNLFLGADVPSYFVLGVNALGIHFIGRDGSLLAFCEYREIVHWGGAYQQYKITLSKPESASSSAAEELLVTTKYSDELTALLSDYKEITALTNDA